MHQKEGSYQRNTLILFVLHLRVPIAAFQIKTMDLRNIGRGGTARGGYGKMGHTVRWDSNSDDAKALETVVNGGSLTKDVQPKYAYTSLPQYHKYGLTKFRLALHNLRNQNPIKGKSDVLSKLEGTFIFLKCLLIIACL